MGSVDVFVPCYKYAHFLKECVESVLSQSGPNVRVLIIDDASPDATPSVARSLVDGDPRVIYRRHERNLGHIATYNEGIEWASAEYYLLLSADDYLLPGALARAADMLDAHPSVGFVFGNAVEQAESGQMNPIRPFAGARAPLAGGILNGHDFISAYPATNVVPTPTAVVRTSLQKTCGFYRQEFPHAGDMEMWFRLAVRGDVGFIEQEQAVQRRHGSNMSNSYFVNRWLPDVVQRWEVLQHFFRENGHRFADIDCARHRSCMALALDAVGFASWAFNDGDERLSQTLSDHALQICADVKKTGNWRRLALKRTFGHRLVRAVSALR
jgi:glycosyltransferase involved in cell wall biosynthesis